MPTKFGKFLAQLVLGITVFDVVLASHHHHHHHHGWAPPPPKKIINRDVIHKHFLHVHNIHRHLLNRHNVHQHNVHKHNLHLTRVTEPVVHEYHETKVKVHPYIKDETHVVPSHETIYKQHEHHVKTHPVLIEHAGWEQPAHSDQHHQLAHQYHHQEQPQQYHQVHPVATGGWNTGGGWEASPQVVEHSSGVASDDHYDYHGYRRRSDTNVAPEAVEKSTVAPAAAPTPKKA